MFGAVAQLVAHLHGMQGVRGSNPLSSTGIKKGTAREGGSFLFAQVLFAQGRLESADGDDGLLDKIAPTVTKCNTALYERECNGRSS